MMVCVSKAITRKGPLATRANFVADRSLSLRQVPNHLTILLCSCENFIHRMIACAEFEMSKLFFIGVHLRCQSVLPFWNHFRAECLRVMAAWGMIAIVGDESAIKSSKEEKLVSVCCWLLYA